MIARCEGRELCREGRGGSGGEKGKVAGGGEGDRRVVIGEGSEIKVIVANMKGKKGKAEGGAVAKVEGEGCGGPKVIETVGGNAGRERGPYVCLICTGTLIY